MTTTTTTFDDDEQLLLRRMMAGDEDAFVALYRRRSGGVYRFALQMCGSETIAEDVTQEVFIVLMRDAEKFDTERGSLAAYLYGIARNHVLRHLARNRSFVSIADDSDMEDDFSIHQQPFSKDDPLRDLTRRETIEQVREAILSLPTHYREVVILCELHEMNYQEAAQVLGCAVGTIRSRLHRARAMLIEKLRTLEQQSATTQKGVNTARCFA